ncbi:DoxX family protein [Parasphingopyxis sp.]|uniref:DoxX family protein n=1 Tax=Parasphingopyxis sp. TaxID=1920299 RepID=UPI0026203E97|nr:DoxX family protein [Parasphingopyxis sp.]
MIVLLGRILLGALFVMAGFNKTQGIDGLAGFLETGPVPGFMAWPTAIFEIVAGLMIIVGFFTRYAAVALALFCIATGVFYHPAEDGGIDIGAMLKNFSVAGGFLILYTHGAGMLSIDARRGGTD